MAFPVEYEDLNLVLSSHVKTGVVTCAYKLSAGVRGRNQRILVAYWTPSLAKMASSKFGVRSCLKKENGARCGGTGL